LQQGIGIRYSSKGIRAASLIKTEDGFRVGSLAAGIPSRGLETFLNENGFILEDVFISAGLCPGDFLSAWVSREKNMGEEEINEVLTWEINRKIISGRENYALDFLSLENTGFVFASRNKTIENIKKEIPGAIIDVEPLAFFNIWDYSPLKSDSPLMLISVEAEGVSSVAVENEIPVCMESFVIREDSISHALSSLDYDEIVQFGDAEEKRIVNYINESVMRLTALGNDKSKIMPENLILAGSGVYLGRIAEKVAQKTGVSAVIFDPFDGIIEGLDTIRHDYQEINSSFTTTLGLALRALAEENL